MCTSFLSSHLYNFPATSEVSTEDSTHKSLSKSSFRFKWARSPWKAVQLLFHVLLHRAVHCNTCHSFPAVPPYTDFFKELQNVLLSIKHFWGISMFTWKSTFICEVHYSILYGGGWPPDFLHGPYLWLIFGSLLVFDPRDTRIITSWFGELSVSFFWEDVTLIYALKLEQPQHAKEKLLQVHLEDYMEFIRGYLQTTRGLEPVTF